MKRHYLFFCYLIIYSNPCFSQSDSIILPKESRISMAKSVIANSFLSIPKDFVQMGHTFSNDWQQTALYAGGIVGLIASDTYTTGFLHDKIEPNLNYKLPKIDFLKTNIDWVDGNNAYIIYPILGLYAGSFVANNRKGQVASVNAIKAITYSYVISHLILKTITARNRPQRLLNDNNPALSPWTKDQWDFGNYHPIYFKSQADGTSFPSFHATFYFSVAKVFQMEYDNYWIPYTIVTGVFLADVKSHQHWVSDLLVGGLLGTIIGKSVVKSSRKQTTTSKNIMGNNPPKFKISKQFVPQISSNFVGLHFIGSF